MIKFVIYHAHIPKLGGIESAIYNLVKLLDPNKYKVTLCYVDNQTDKSLFKYAEYCDIKRIRPFEEIRCDVCLIASNFPLPYQIKAKKCLQWVHADYEQYKIDLVRNKGVVNYVAVSNHIAKIANKLFGIEPVVIYNIIDPDFKLSSKKGLKFVTNSRISPEKGFERMKLMAQGMQDLGIEYQWRVYGDNVVAPDYYRNVVKSFQKTNVQFLGFRDDIREGLEWADYLVQLSDFEGCPYSVLEALKVKVPCILTEFPSAYELIKEGENGYIVPFDMNYDFTKFKEVPKNVKLLTKGEIKQWENLLD